jgi:hypothetical protein
MILALAAATPLAAQKRYEVTLEGSFVRGTLGYARA